MKVLIVGCGAVAYVLSTLLAKDKSVSKIFCASKDVKKAKKFIPFNKKIKLVKLDASRFEDVVKAAKGVDLVVNASLPYFNEIIMRAALKVKADYQDLCSELKDLKTAEQLKFDKQFRKAKLVAVINTGVSPGVTNLLAGDIADKLDSVSAIKIRLLEEQKASEFVPSWSVEVTLDELSAPPLVYCNKKFCFREPFGDFEEYHFVHPYGKRIAVNLFADEVATIPKFIKTSNIDCKSSGSDIDFSRIIFKMGLLSYKPIKVKNSRIVPIELFAKIAPKVPSPKKMRELINKKIIENSVFVSVVEGEGVESGRKIKIKKAVVYPDLKNINKIMPGATYISYPTGLAAYAFLKALPKIRGKGVFPPERLSSDVRKEVLLELENHGIIVQEEFSKR